MAPEHLSPGAGADRILNAAISLFGQHGVRGTTLKAIATEAEVSQALIVHHYGSKEGLRSACDTYVADIIRERKEETLAAAPQFDPLMALRRLENGRPLLQYLIRTLTEGGTHATQLIDELIADAQQYMEQAEQAGVIKRSEVPRDRAVLLVIWSMGALALHEHVHRLLGVDFLAQDTGPEQLQRYMRPAMELFTQGIIVEGALEQLSDFLGSTETAGTSDAHFEAE